MMCRRLGFETLRPLALGLYRKDGMGYRGSTPQKSDEVANWILDIPRIPLFGFKVHLNFFFGILDVWSVCFGC